MTGILELALTLGVIAVAASFVMLARKLWRSGMILKYQSGQDVSRRWRECARCAGCGVLWLRPGGGWDVIPREIRSFSKTEVRGRIANVRNCPDCHGMGQSWVEVTRDDEGRVQAARPVPVITDMPFVGD